MDLQVTQLYDFVQLNDPGAVGAGKTWLSTLLPWTLFQRDITNSSWANKGSWFGPLSLPDDNYDHVMINDPGAIGADKDWLDISRLPWTGKRRNSDNTGWTTVGTL